MTDYIVMDIGGTNARIALSTPGGLQDTKYYHPAEFDGPGAVVAAYCRDTGIEKPAQGVFAVSGPVKDPAAHRVTNGAWNTHDVDFTNFGMKPTLMNDFAAQAYATLILKPEDYIEVVAGRDAFFPSVLLDRPAPDGGEKNGSLIAGSDPAQRIVVLGPGTGLGVATASVVDGRFIVEDSEGAHSPLPVKGETETLVFSRLKERQGITDVTFETECSGPGLVRLYNALSLNTAPVEPEHVVELSKTPGNPAVAEALRIFTGVMGRCAATATLFKNARGGVIIAGGIIGKLGSAFDAAAFEHEFRANDLRTANFVRQVAVHAVVNPNSGLIGAHAYAQHRLG